MSRIRIKNFGPIKDGFRDENGNEWMDINKVTTFIGNQGSGKSTVAKLISIFTWLEKARNRGDEIKTLTRDKFLEYFQYQGLQNYFSKESILEYSGDAFDIEVERDGFFTFFEKQKKHYIVPKIMYVPAERNFLSIVKNAFNVTGLPSSLFTFAEELRRAQKELSGETLNLPINNYSYNYDDSTETSILKGREHQINLLEASSGLQSSVPLFLVSRNIAHAINNKEVVGLDDKSVSQNVKMMDELISILQNSSLTIAQKAQLIIDIRSKYENRCFINIVEEPEQNLFPTSQWLMLQKLLEFNNMNEGNKLIMTTHSPYIINFLSISIQAGYLKDKMQGSNKENELLQKLENITSIQSIIHQNDVVVYQLNEKEGNIAKLPNYEGIPSDRNYLNQLLRHGNEMFDSLLEIEQEL